MSSPKADRSSSTVFNSPLAGQQAPAPQPSAQDSSGRSVDLLQENPSTEGLAAGEADQEQTNILNREVSYYERTGQNARNIIPSLNDRPFNDYWEKVPGLVDHGVVNHKLMRVKPTTGKERAVPVTGRALWHIKTPGYESGAETFKRLLQKLVYLITGQHYKARFYDDRKVLAQRECLAAEVYKQLMGYGQEYIYRYALDEERGDHCIASKDLPNHFPGNRYFNQEVWPGISEFSDDENPVTNLVIRRFLLGDQDYLKLDNYQVGHAAGKDANVGRMVSIDFGMSFYNRFSLPENCSETEFARKLLEPSKLHRLQYRGKKTLLDLVDEMDKAQVARSIHNTLEKIADMSDERLANLAGHMHQPEVRNAMLRVLEFKRSQARAMLGKSDWPAEHGGRNGLFSALGRPYRST